MCCWFVVCCVVDYFQFSVAFVGTSFHVSFHLFLYVIQSSSLFSFFHILYSFYVFLLIQYSPNSFFSFCLLLIRVPCLSHLCFLVLFPGRSVISSLLLHIICIYSLVFYLHPSSCSFLSLLFFIIYSICCSLRVKSLWSMSKFIMSFLAYEEMFISKVSKIFIMVPRNYSKKRDKLYIWTQKGILPQYSYSFRFQENAWAPSVLSVKTDCMVICY